LEFFASIAITGGAKMLILNSVHIYIVLKY